MPPKKGSKAAGSTPDPVLCRHGGPRATSHILECINMMVNHNQFGVTEEDFLACDNDEEKVRVLLFQKMKRFISRHPEVDAYVIKSSELNFKPVKDPMGKIKTGTVGPWACERYECTGDMQLQTFRKGAGDNLLEGLSMKDYFDSRQTLADKVMRASAVGAAAGAGAPAAATPSAGTFFNFGERARESQKAKMLAKLNTPHKRFEKKIKASMWMSQDFPLTLEHVTPMLEVLSMQDKVIHKLKEVLTTKGMREAGFPAKVSLPLYLGVFAAVTFDNCKVFKRGELEPELFLVNPEYGSSKRMRKGLYEGVMPGNVILRAANARDRDGTGGRKAGVENGGGERAREHGLSSSASMATEVTRQASSSTSSNMNTPHHPASVTAPATTGAQPHSKMWQPSYGPGSPQIPVADIARASSKTRASANANGISSGRVLGKPTAGQAAAIAAAAGRAHQGPNARRDSDSGAGGGGGAGGGWGGSSRALGEEMGERRGSGGGSGGRGNESAQPARVADAAGHLMRGAQAWMGIETREEWEAGGESDEGSSDEDEEEDDLVLRR